MSDTKVYFGAVRANEVNLYIPIIGMGDIQLNIQVDKYAVICNMDCVIKIIKVFNRFWNSIAACQHGIDVGNDIGEEVLRLDGTRRVDPFSSAGQCGHHSGIFILCSEVIINLGSHHLSGNCKEESIEDGAGWL